MKFGESGSLALPSHNPPSNELSSTPRALRGRKKRIGITYKASNEQRDEIGEDKDRGTCLKWYQEEEEDGLGWLGEGFSWLGSKLEDGKEKKRR